MEDSQLKLIFVSDIHLSHKNIEKLEQHVNTSEEHFEYCIVGGDIAKFNHYRAEQPPAEEKEQMAAETKKVLQTLNDIFQVKVIFVPGNHDPVSFFEQKSVLNPEIINIHKSEFMLQPGLRIVGLGGSLPGYSDPEHTNAVWEYYPYHEDKDLNTDL